MPKIHYLTDGRTMEIGSDAARRGKVLEVPLIGKSGNYPLYEITALA